MTPISSSIQPLRFLSLFSGIGGLDLGLERAGMKCVAQVEIDPFCRKVLAKHWPDVPRFEDVRTFGHRSLSEIFDEGVDLIAGGFPCKQTSVAASITNNRLGLLGRDSGLWFELLRIVGEVRPEWVLVENVSGAQSWLAEIKNGLARVGYSVSIARTTAAAFGAPHLRGRMFIIANSDRQGLAFTRQSRPFQAECLAWRTSERNPWVSSIPELLRVVDGVPGGLDRRSRITALGNSVVPACAEWIGRHIVAAHKGERAAC